MHVYPKEIPEKLRKMEEERIAKYKSVRKMVSDLEKENSQKTEELEKNRKAFDEEITTLNDNNSSLKTQLESALEDVETLRKEKLKAEAEIREQKASAAQVSEELPLAYLVMTRDDNIQAVYKVFEGENSFGYSISQGRHNQILCGAVEVADKHFMIKATVSLGLRNRRITKFYVRPYEGIIYGAAGNGNIINSEEVFDKNSSVFIDNLKFTLVENKV